MNVGTFFIVASATWAITLGAAAASDASVAPTDAARQEAHLIPEVITPWPAVLPCASPRTLHLPADAASDVEWSWTARHERLAVSFEKKYANKSDEWFHLGPRFPVGRLERLAAGSNGPNLLCRRTTGDFPDDEAAGPSIEWGPCGSGTCEVSATYAIPRRPNPYWRTFQWTEPKPGFDWEEWEPPASAPRFQREITPPPNRDAAQARRSSIALTRDMMRDLRDDLQIGCGRGRCTARVRAADRALATFLRTKPLSYEGQGAGWSVAGGGVRVDVACDVHSDGVILQIMCWKIDVDLGTDKLRYEQRENQVVFEAPAGLIEFNWEKRVVTISGAALSLRGGR
jgi:hypothetical protein